MCEKHSYQIINTSAVNQAVFCYYEKAGKNHYKIKNISFGGSEQCRDTLV